MDSPLPEIPSTPTSAKPKASRTPLVAITTAIVCSLGAIYGTLQWIQLYPDTTLPGIPLFGIKPLRPAPQVPPLTPEEKAHLARIEEAHRVRAVINTQTQDLTATTGKESTHLTQPHATPGKPTQDQNPSIPAPFPGKPNLTETNTTPQSTPSETIPNPFPSLDQKASPPPKATQNTTPNQTDKSRPIDTVDPRELGINTNDGPEKAYEQTKLTVSRTLAAQLENNERQLLRLDVPVMYKSRSLRLDEATQKEAQELLKELKSESQKLKERKISIQAKLNAWNKIINKATPTQALLPESPTIPQNQSGNIINRDENPNLVPGKRINYEVTPLQKTNK